MKTKPKRLALSKRSVWIPAVFVLLSISIIGYCIFKSSHADSAISKDKNLVSKTTDREAKALAGPLKIFTIIFDTQGQNAPAPAVDCSKNPDQSLQVANCSEIYAIKPTVVPQESSDIFKSQLTIFDKQLADMGWQRTGSNDFRNDATHPVDNPTLGVPISYDKSINGIDCMLQITTGSDNGQSNGKFDGSLFCELPIDYKTAPDATYLD